MNNIEKKYIVEEIDRLKTEIRFLHNTKRHGVKVYGENKINNLITQKRRILLILNQKIKTPKKVKWNF